MGSHMSMFGGAQYSVEMNKNKNILVYTKKKNSTILFM